MYIFTRASIFDYLNIIIIIKRSHGQQRSTASVVWRWRGVNLNSVSRDTVGASVTSNMPSSAIRATVAVVCVFRASHPFLWCGAATGQWKHQLQPETRGSWEALNNYTQGLQAVAATDNSDHIFFLHLFLQAESVRLTIHCIIGKLTGSISLFNLINLMVFM